MCYVLLATMERRRPVHRVITSVLITAVLGISAEAHAQSVPVGTALTPEQMQADLAVFRSDFLQRDRSYSVAARAEAERRLTQLADDVSPMRRVQFELALAQIVALADNGHTMSFAGPRSERFNRVPIRLTPFGDAFHVLRATPPNADLLGARVTGVEGAPLRQVLDSARTLTGGVPAWRDRSASYLIESPEQLHAIGLIADATGARYEFETPDGRRVTRALVGESPDSSRLGGGASRWLDPELAAGQQDAWRAFVPDRVPWSLLEAEVPFRSRDLRELDAVVVQLRRNHNAPGRPIRTALSEFTRIIGTVGRRHLVLDMRQNGGGDLNTTRDFMQSLPGLVPGRIFVLMSPWTFSAAISSIGYLEQAAPEKVTLVGEGPGDRLEFFAEGNVVTLPNSGVGLLIATERHDYRRGCAGMDDCHGSVVRHPIAVPSLAPDISAPWTFAAYVAGRDPGMEAVANALRAGSASPPQSVPPR